MLQYKEQCLYFSMKTDIPKKKEKKTDIPRQEFTSFYENSNPVSETTEAPNTQVFVNLYNCM